jgi:prepilin-type N-terminal cleavage/methylation domain-containing protein
MNKKKGFTLIELLAVIVVLAVVLIIAVPAIGNIIERSRRNTFQSSAKGLIDSAKYFHSKNVLSLSEEPYVFSFEDGKKGEAVVNNKTYRLAYSGTAPTNGRVILYTDGKVDLNVCNDKYCACKGSGTSVIFMVDKEVEICGVNGDGTTSDNPILSGQIALLQEQLDELKEETAKNKTDMANLNLNFTDKTYPVGSIFITTTLTTEIDLKAKFGELTEWEPFGTGRTLVGIDTSQTEFNTISKIGGAKTHTLSIAQLPSHAHGLSDGTVSNAGAHTHSVTGSISTAGSHTHSVSGSTGGAGAHSHQAASGSYKVGSGSGSTYTYFTNSGTTGPQNTSGVGDHAHSFSGTAASAGDHSHTFSSGSAASAGAHTHSLSGSSNSTGSGSAYSILQPYITVYMWKRTN